LAGPDIFNPASLSGSSTPFLYFERIYTQLPQHDYVTFLGKFWYFGDFSKVEELGLSIVLDRTPRLTEETARQALNAAIQTRNFTEGEANFDNIKMGTYHVGDTLVLRIYLHTNKDDKISIGFRDLTIHLSSDSGNKMDQKFYCHVSEGHQDLFEKWASWKCPLNQGRNGSSQSCSENCACCYGAKPSQCVACAEGAHWNGKECSKCHWNCKTCTGPTEHECSVCNYGHFNYDNGTCLETCEWPFKGIEFGSGWRCIKACGPKKFIWSNGSSKEIDACVDECKPPLISYITDQNIHVCENPCPKKNDFLYWNGTCISSCHMPLREDFNSYSRICKNPCEVASQYLYSNGACHDNCPAPLRVRSNPGVTYCENPCSNPRLYLYQNSSCHSSCRFPFKVIVEYGVKHCLPPCNLVGEYILQNGSCSRECPPPLIQRTELGVGVHCLNPCESDDHFVLMNGSCLLNCPSFLDVRVEHGVKRCLSLCSPDQYYFNGNRSCLERCPYPLQIVKSEGVNLCRSPCSEFDDFIYDDQSCHSSCPEPLISLIEPGATGKYCKNLCVDEEGGKKYLHLDGSCQESCEYPYKIGNHSSYEICRIDLSATQIYQISSIQKIVKVSNTISEIGGFLSTLMNAGDPTSIFMMSLLRMLEIVKYTKITFPGNIELCLNRGRLLKDKKGFEDLQNIFDEKLAKIGIICLITLILYGALKIVKSLLDGSRVIKLLEECSFALQWNILASVLISFTGDITLYALVGLNYSGILPLISLFGILPIILFLIHKIIQVNSELNSDQEVSASRLQRWKFIFEVYKNERLYQQLFVLIYLVRVVSVSIIIGCLYEYLLIQAIFLVFVSLGMVSYLFCASPIKNISSFIQHIIVEIALLLDNFLLVILAVIDGSQNIDADVKNAFGQLMTILYLIAPILTVIIIVVKLLRNICSFWKTSSPNIESSSAGGFIQLSEMDRDGESNAVLNNETVQESSRMAIMETDEINNGKSFVFF